MDMQDNARDAGAVGLGYPWYGTAASGWGEDETGGGPRRARPPAAADVFT